MIGIRDFRHVVAEATCEQTRAQWERHRDTAGGKGHQTLGHGQKTLSSTRSEGPLGTRCWCHT